MNRDSYRPDSHREESCHILTNLNVFTKCLKIIFQNTADILKVYRCTQSKPQNAIDQLGKFRVYLREKVAGNGNLFISETHIPKAEGALEYAG